MPVYFSGDPTTLGAMVVIIPLLALLVYLFNRHQMVKPVSAKTAMVLVTAVIVVLVLLINFLEKHF